MSITSKITWLILNSRSTTDWSLKFISIWNYYSYLPKLMVSVGNLITRSFSYKYCRSRHSFILLKRNKMGNLEMCGKRSSRLNWCLLKITKIVNFRYLSWHGRFSKWSGLGDRLEMSNDETVLVTHESQSVPLSVYWISLL